MAPCRISRYATQASTTSPLDQAQARLNAGNPAKAIEILGGAD